MYEQYIIITYIVIIIIYYDYCDSIMCIKCTKLISSIIENFPVHNLEMLEHFNILSGQLRHRCGKKNLQCPVHRKSGQAMTWLAILVATLVQGTHGTCFLKHFQYRNAIIYYIAMHMTYDNLASIIADICRWDEFMTKTVMSIVCTPPVHPTMSWYSSRDLLSVYEHL